MTIHGVDRSALIRGAGEASTAARLLLAARHCGYSPSRLSTPGDAVVAALALLHGGAAIVAFAEDARKMGPAPSIAWSGEG